MTRSAYSAARRPSRASAATHAVADQLERRADLELLDVLGEIAGRHSLVDLLVAGERAELLDPGLHVVAGDPLPRVDRREVDLVDHGLVGLDRAVRHLDAELLLRPEHGQPEPALQDDLLFRRPELRERRGGVPRRQDIRDELGHNSLSDHFGFKYPSPACRIT